MENRPRFKGRMRIRTRATCTVAAIALTGLFLAACPPTPPATYTVTYDSNGATGGSIPADTADYLPGDTVTVLGNSGFLEKTGNAFSGWNTRADRGGTAFTPGQTFTMGSSDVILYASWGGLISTVAGAGTRGYSGDEGPAVSAQLRYPAGVAVDSDGNLYIADQGNDRVRKVSPGGTITTVAGTGTGGYSGDGDLATNAMLHDPTALAVDSDGNLFIVDLSNHCIRRVDTDGIITTVAGTGTAGYSGDGGPAASAMLHTPLAVAFDSAGNLFISETVNQRVRKVSTAGTITTVAGNGTPGYSGDGGPATSAQLHSPHGLAFDSSGNLFISEEYGYRIRMVSTTGTITTAAGTSTPGYSGDGGPATSAEFFRPSGLAFNPAAGLFVAEQGNHCIRKISTAGTITTVAGNGTPGYAGDGGPATSARLLVPYGVAVDSAGNIYIADSYNHRIRKVTAP